MTHWAPFLHLSRDELALTTHLREKSEHMRTDVILCRLQTHRLKKALQLKQALTP
jgi:hypothetical protein